MTRVDPADDSGPAGFAVLWLALGAMLGSMATHFMMLKEGCQ